MTELNKQQNRKVGQLLAVLILTTGLLLTVMIGKAIAVPHTQCTVTTINGESINPNVNLTVKTDVDTYTLNNIEATPHATNTLTVFSNNTQDVDAYITVDGKRAELWKDYSSHIKVSCQPGEKEDPVDVAPPTTSMIETLPEEVNDVPEIIKETPVTTVPVIVPVDAPEIPEAQPAEAIKADPKYTG